MLVLTISVILFGAIFAEAYKLNNPEAGTFTLLFQGIIFSYNMCFCAWEGAFEFNTSQYIVFLVGSCLIPLIMFNLLIAIITDTYIKVESEKVLRDIRGIVDVLLDFSYFTIMLRKIFRRKRTQQ